MGKLARARTRTVLGIVCLLRIIAASLAAMVLVASHGTAADIRLSGEAPRQIVVEGQLVQGDYEKFVDAVLEGGASYRRVFLASKGGDAREAMKIGRLVRSLRYDTALGGVSPIGPKGGIICPYYIKQENCICLSACPLIYLAGVDRSGEALGVHRIYISHEQLKQLSFDEAKRASDLVTARITQYLDEMGTPNSLKEKITGTASDRIEILDRDYVQQKLSGYAPGYEEWFLARCGSTRQMYKTLRESKDREAKKVHEQYRRIIECGNSELEKESRKRFHPSMIDALKAVDRKFVSPASTLSKVTPVNSMADALGKTASEGMPSLVLFGAGWDRKLDYSTVKNVSIQFNRLFTVIFDEAGRIAYIIMWANKVPFNGDDRAYIGMFHDGLTTASSPMEIVAKIGRLTREGCFKTGVCLAELENEKFILTTHWEPDRTTLRSLEFKMRKQ